MSEERDPEPQTRDVTALLRAGAAGDHDALGRVSTLLYDELRRLARRQLRGERADHTLQPTALVHEAYLRLAGAEIDWHDRVHFLSLAARQMRRILVDHARGKDRIKRGDGAIHLSLEAAVAVAAAPEGEILAVDRAFEDLARLDPRQARLLELHLFAGLTYEELAVALSISSATVHRELRLGRAWLRRALGGDP